MKTTNQDCQILEKLRSDDDSILQRALYDESTILILTAKNQRHSAKLENEFDLRRSLDQAWALIPFELRGVEPNKSLLFHDNGDSLLTQRLKEKLDLTEFLQLAISILTAVSRMHRSGIVHKELTPNNLLINAKTSDVHITGFGLASRMPRETQQPVPLEVISGTFAYMSPEQTGRMNRSIDSRSDLYTLGVIFYEMLTGSLPFNANDPLSWVHCHTSRIAAPPSQLRPEIPSILSKIIMRLLAKTAETRYQTAHGVESDLRKCLTSFRETGEMGSFVLGDRDVSGKIIVPEKLYGREVQRDQLMHAVNRVITNGSVELVTISGYSGIGKTSLVNEIHKVTSSQSALYISGKFDQYKRNVPYETLTFAFKGLVNQLLTKKEEELVEWRTAILQAVGSYGDLICELIPELEFVIGKQTKVVDIGAAEANYRFQLVFSRFLSVFATAEHPVIMFLDDLQWADSASLKMIENFITNNEIRFFLLICSYRDNEVTVAHPAMLALESIKRRGAIASDILLTPLTRNDVSQLVADSMVGSTGTSVVADLIYEKSMGNPFFTIQFLTTLAANQLVQYCEREGTWTWQVDQIASLAYTDNVIDLMIERLRQLPNATIEILQIFACIGQSVDVTILARACQKSLDDVYDGLWPAILDGIVVLNDASYRFLHDRIHAAAYSLIDVYQLPSVHLTIARLFLSQMTNDEIEMQLFDIVNHLNNGLSRIHNRNEKDKVISLNIRAAFKAKDSIAYAAAQHYFLQAIALLHVNTWVEDYEKTYNLYLALAECTYLDAKFDQSDEFFKVVLKNAKSNIDKAKVHNLRTSLYQITGQYDRAVTASIEAFSLFDISLPSKADLKSEIENEMQQVAINMRGRKIIDLLDAPVTDDPEITTKLDVFSAAIPPFFASRAALFPLITLKAINLSLVHGNTVASCTAYSTYALLLISYGDIANAFEFSSISLQLNERFKDVARRGRLLFMHGCFINFWKQSFAKTIPYLEQSFLACSESGDMPFASYSSYVLPTQILEKNERIETLLKTTNTYLAFANNNRNEVVQKTILCIHQVALCMIGQTNGDGILDDGKFNKSEVLSFFSKAKFEIGAVRMHVMQQIASFVFHNYEDALSAAKLASSQIGVLRATSSEATHHYYYALTLTALFTRVSVEQQSEFKEVLVEHLLKLQRWAENCPDNYQNRYLLVQAEMARIEGRNDEAMYLYDNAIDSAHTHGFIQNEAMCYELAANFYKQLGHTRIELSYLFHARRCYMAWGATRKADQLTIRIPSSYKSDNKDDSAILSSQLDMKSVFKASQAVSSAIVLDNLIETLLRIVVEHACATGSVLLLQNETAYEVVAEVTVKNSEVFVKSVKDGATSSKYPKSMVQYVMRTRQHIHIDDARTENLYSNDQYVRESLPISVLCLPLLNQGSLTGILYIENNLASSVFTPNRLAILELIGSQAAISLENARLYNNLISENSERKKAELELQAHRDQLELTIAERTQEIINQNKKLEDAYKAIEEVSLTDPLTGLRNRRFLMQHLDLDIALCLRRYVESMENKLNAAIDGLDIVFFMVDLDHFKEVNDKHGHSAGDQVLIQIRERLQEVFRDADYLIRWGGEEFLVVARATNRESAPMVAERVRIAFSDRAFVLDDGTKLAKTCSIGYACFPFFREHPRLLSWQQVVELADQALYKSKNDGRNTWAGVSGGDCINLDNVAKRLLSDFDGALEKGEIEMDSK